MKIKYSKDKIWWNNLTDDKPNVELFYSFLENLEETDLKVNYINETTINVVVEEIGITYISITDDKGFVFNYFYDGVEKIIDGGYVLKFTLDLFGTYTILGLKELIDKNPKVFFERIQEKDEDFFKITSDELFDSVNKIRDNYSTIISNTTTTTHASTIYYMTITLVYKIGIDIGTTLYNSAITYNGNESSKLLQDTFDIHNLYLVARDENIDNDSFILFPIRNYSDFIKINTAINGLYSINSSNILGIYNGFGEWSVGVNKLVKVTYEIRYINSSGSEISNKTVTLTGFCFNPLFGTVNAPYMNGYNTDYVDAESKVYSEIDISSLESTYNPYYLNWVDIKMGNNNLKYHYIQGKQINYYFSTNIVGVLNNNGEIGDMIIDFGGQLPLITDNYYDFILNNAAGWNVGIQNAKNNYNISQLNSINSLISNVAKGNISGVASTITGNLSSTNNYNTYLDNLKASRLTASLTSGFNYQAGTNLDTFLLTKNIYSGGYERGFKLIYEVLNSNTIAKFEYILKYYGIGLRKEDNFNNQYMKNEFSDNGSWFCKIDSISNSSWFINSLSTYIPNKYINLILNDLKVGVRLWSQIPN